tara:strand:+ start:1449 stop:1682 length:234 start_codon:yes stop_codon:yes gene_type:complete
MKRRSKNDSEVEQEGTKWKIIGKYPTFKAADHLRNMLRDDDENDVKIHKNYKNNIFVVKLRSKSLRAAKKGRQSNAS